MSNRHFYKGMDDSGEYDLSVSVSMRKLAEKLVNVNSGVHRLLSHLVDVRREKMMERIETYVARGDYDVAAYASTRGDPLMDAIATLLDEGAY